MATLQLDLGRAVAHSGLAPLRLAGFTVDDDGIWHYPGMRPGPDWHVHGSFVAGQDAVGTRGGVGAAHGAEI